MEENKELDIRDQEKEKLLIDHDFDGIKELDNPPPPWLVYLFYASIIFAGIYFFVYHVFKTADTQEERYEEELAKFESSQPTETLKLAFTNNKEELAKGEELYNTKTCATCHGAKLEGNSIGPNLTDEYWIHGNTIENLVDIISNGNIPKGMTAFKTQMTPEEIVWVSSYIWSKQGSNPANAKEPQGEKM
jgi:cytochrome c oxidase cbb3-type subunit 3